MILFFSPVANSLHHLNPGQRAAVLHEEGPLLILAGAGSGKTSTMTQRIAYLIAERNVPASNILGLSFTKKAADELRTRVRTLVRKKLGPQASKGLTIATFHSLCARLLRQYASEAGLNSDFTILDTNDQEDVVRGILKHLHVDDRKFDPSRILFEIGQTKNRFLPPAEAQAYLLSQSKHPGDYAEIAAVVYEKYQEHLQATSTVDFDDLIYRTVSMLEQNKTVRLACNLKFRHILVDEYQDTNPAQFRLLRALTERQQNLCVVGDDDQSIYGWRGADATHILEFSHQFAGAQIITLDQNYRSTSTILDAANDVIAKNTHRHPKRLWSKKGKGEPIELILAEEDRSEAELVAEEILKLAQSNVEGKTTQTRPWKDFAVLYRSNPQSRLFEEALRLHQIPYKIVGSFSFLDRKEIKDLLAYWRLILNPGDDSAFRRILNWPSRGFGKSLLERIQNDATSHARPLLTSLRHGSEFLPKLGQQAEAFAQLITEIRSDLEKTPLQSAAISEWARSTLQRLEFKRGIEEDAKDPVQASQKWENVEELCNAIGQISIEELQETLPELGPLDVLREFISRMMLSAMEEEEDKKKDDQESKRDEVTLLTLHGSKGLEFPVVFMVGMEEGLLPHRRTIEEARDFSEERRLAYVGITRAKEKLLLLRAKNRIRYGKKVPRTPSRFLEDIPQDLLLVRDESFSPDLSSPEAQEKHEAKVKDFLSQIRAQLGEKPRH